MHKEPETTEDKPCKKAVQEAYSKTAEAMSCLKEDKVAPCKVTSKDTLIEKISHDWPTKKPAEAASCMKTAKAMPVEKIASCPSC